jgi:hypothetical protein
VRDEMLVLNLDIGVQLLALLHGVLYYNKWAKGRGGSRFQEIEEEQRKGHKVED